MRTPLLVFALAAPLVMQGQPPEGSPRKSLRERAAAGNAEAQFNLAKMFETGRSGYPKDYVQAEHWYREAAEQGDAFAQASLAILFRFGKGIPRDYVQAYKWFSLAAERTESGDRVTIVEMRDATAARMDPKELAQAQQMVKQWKPRPAAKP